MKKLLTKITPLTLLLLPISVFGQVDGYQPLVGIPGYDPNTNTFVDFLNILYALSISVAALLAVIKIIVAGAKWMLTDVVTSKGEAKRDIQGALLGLLVVISAVIILTLINPNLVDFSGSRVIVP